MSTNTTSSNESNIGAQAGERTGAIPPPPHHPVPAPDSASVHSTSSHPSTAVSVGADHGDRLKGVFSAIHGAGEAIRGTINDTLDGLGDGVAGRQHGTVESRSSASTGETVAQKGEREFKEGIAHVQGAKTA
ncbi:hypothetical protein JCM10213_006268 [Rhodosporidiobolus nylandii]